jgi:hypothetical protein
MDGDAAVQIVEGESILPDHIPGDLRGPMVTTNLTVGSTGFEMVRLSACPGVVVGAHVWHAHHSLELIVDQLILRPMRSCVLQRGRRARSNVKWSNSPQIRRGRIGCI